MGRRAKGWVLELNTSGFWRVRFTLHGRRFQVSTGCRERGEATSKAPAIYAAHVAAAGKPARSEPGQGLDLVVLSAEWIADYGRQLASGTKTVYETYATTWCEFFRTSSRLTAASVRTFARKRLGLIKRKTLLKELAALRVFLRWCHDQGIDVMHPKDVESPSRSATGTASKTKRHKPGAITLTDAQATALIDALPTHLQSRARFMYETSLRPSTVARLRAPGDYHEGRATLRIRDEADKARFGRELPLTPDARAALDAACPDVGLIFGPYGKLQKHMRRAAKAIGLSPQIVTWLSPYDLRHTALTRMAKGGDLGGAAYLAGHKHLTTTAKYMHPTQAAAERVIAALSDSGPRHPAQPKTPAGTNRKTKKVSRR